MLRHVSNILLRSSLTSQLRLDALRSATEARATSSVFALLQTFDYAASIPAYTRGLADRSVAARRLDNSPSKRTKAVGIRDDTKELARGTETHVVQPSESTASELQLRDVIDHPALVITRPVEWGTLLLGYEQANKYQVYDEQGELVALIAEDITGVGNAIGRQVLRTRRSFTATVFNATGEQVLFRVRRPAYVINSSMFIEDAEQNVIGEVHQRWHLLKRNYDLYLHRRQFARIEGNFLAWEFELKDQQGGTLALIDRNFQGFGKELFTDAGKYVIHFGFKPAEAAQIATETVRARSGKPEAPDVAPVAAGNELVVIPTTAANQLVVARPLDLEERLVALAAAISVDYNYFSQHSQHGSGWFAPPLFMPRPGGGSGGGEAAEGAAGGAEGAAGAAGATGGVPPGGDAGAVDAGFSGGSNGDQQLGGDAFPGQGSDAFPGQGGAAQEWGDDSEMKWDLPGGDAGGGDEDSGVFGTIKKMWEMFNDD